MINTFGQMGASSPVTIAGCLAQTNAETLAGMVFAYCINPNVKALYGARPMITDLRTGGMAGGSGEQAMLTAAASQIAKLYDLPNSTIAGATDSKLPDAQSGYEKALTIAMAAQAGANIITQAAGTQAGLMATSFAAYVIDNDMLGTILKAAQPIEVSSDTLSVTRISDAVRGDGHFLGQSETYQRMKSDFVYPDLADRRPPELWQSDPGPDLGQKAKDTALEILATHFPNHLSLDIQDLLRQKFAIELPTERMRPK
jgi:trimethylamine--corrinoid protein Co-methyltransferase